jgi:hypothetical protein
MTPTKTEWTFVVFLSACVLLIFGIGASNLGFYFEDSGFITVLTSADLLKFWDMFTNGSVPGRNLYVVWQVLLYKLVGTPASHMVTLHLIQSLIDSVIVSVFFVALRRVGASPASSFAAAGLFAFWPIHGETHYWTPGTPYNLSTLFLLLFMLTSIRIVQPPHPRLWLWIVDALLFAFALFTYDQLVILIGLCLLLRISILICRSRRRSFAVFAEHAFHLSIYGLYFFQKINTSTGHGPSLSAESWVRFWPNAHQILLYNFGDSWLQTVKPLYDSATASDMWLSALAAMVVMAISVATLKASRVVPNRSLLLLAEGAIFFVLAYIPVMLWHLAPRHNFLPSIGLFACVAALLDLFFFRTKLSALGASPIIATGIAVFFFAAVGRGESHYWEKSFAAKKQLYADLTKDIKDVEILVLQGFPVQSGPAWVITPHDANFGPKLVYADIPSFQAGDICSSPAHEGIFLNTWTRFYEQSFSYHASNNILIVRFTKWLNNNRFTYDIISRNDDPTYKIIDSEMRDYRGPFAVESATMVAQGANSVLSLDVRSALPPTSHLVITLSVEGDFGFETWGRRTADGFVNISPILLDSGKESTAGIRALDSGRESKDGIRFKGRLLLYSFPKYGRVRINGFAASGHGGLTHLGDWDMPFDSSRASANAIQPDLTAVPPEILGASIQTQGKSAMDSVDGSIATPDHGNGVFSINGGALVSCDGWAFDDVQQTTPEAVWIELTHAGTQQRYYWPAHRYARPALAAALRIPSIERSGITCRPVGYRLPVGSYTMKVYQVDQKTAFVSDFSTYTLPPIMRVK